MSTYKDRVLETSTTTGTGDLTLAGAITGYQTFNTAVGTLVRFDYAIVGVDGSGVPTGEWEVGYGHLSASTTLVRQQPISGSASTPVSFTAGTKRVFITQSAQQAVSRNKIYAQSVANVMP
jgi:hypothetical protein